MMEQCSKCVFYDEQEEKELLSLEDIIFVDPHDERFGEHRYCTIYKELYYGIPKSIMNDAEKCKDFEERGELWKMEQEALQAVREGEDPTPIMEAMKKYIKAHGLENS